MTKPNQTKLGKKDHNHGDQTKPDDQSKPNKNDHNHGDQTKPNQTR